MLDTQAWINAYLTGDFAELGDENNSKDFKKQFAYESVLFGHNGNFRDWSTEEKDEFVQYCFSGESIQSFVSFFKGLDNNSISAFNYNLKIREGGGKVEDFLRCVANLALHAPEVLLKILEALSPDQLGQLDFNAMPEDHDDEDAGETVLQLAVTASIIRKRPDIIQKILLMSKWEDLPHVDINDCSIEQLGCNENYPETLFDDEFDEPIMTNIDFYIKLSYVRYLLKNEWENDFNSIHNGLVGLANSCADNGYPDPIYHLGRFYEDYNNIESAIDCYKSVDAKSQYFKDSCDRAFGFYFSNGNFVKAFDAARKLGSDGYVYRQRSIESYIYHEDNPNKDMTFDDQKLIRKTLSHSVNLLPPESETSEDVLKMLAGEFQATKNQQEENERLKEQLKTLQSQLDQQNPETSGLTAGRVLGKRTEPDSPRKDSDINKRHNGSSFFGDNASESSDEESFVSGEVHNP